MEIYFQFDIGFFCWNTTCFTYKIILWKSF